MIWFNATAMTRPYLKESNFALVPELHRVAIGSPLLEGQVHFLEKAFVPLSIDMPVPGTSIESDEI